MDKPQISKFEMIAPIIIQKYERYLPTAFDESMTLLEKMNKIIEYLNQVGLIVGDVVTQWNQVMEWILNDGLNEAVNNKLDEMATDGTLASLINEVLFAELNKKIEDRTQHISLKTYENLAVLIQNGKDWTPAIKQAIADAKLNGRAIDLHVDETIYIGEAIVLNDTIKMYGSGSFNTVIETINSNSGFDLSSEAPKMGVILEGFTIRGKEILSSVGIDLNYFTNTSSVRNLRIEKFGVGLRLKKSWYSSFDNIQMNGNVKYGLHCISLTSLTQVNNINFSRLFIRESENNVFLQGTNVSAGIKFDSCSFEKSRKTSFVSNKFSPLVLQNCYFEANYSDATLTETLTALTPIDMNITNTSSRTNLILIGCYFARRNDFITSSNKIGILLDENTKASIIAPQFVCNTSAYIDVDIKSNATTNKVEIQNAQQDGYAKKLYEGELKEQTISMDENVNMRFTTELDKLNFEMKRGDEYFLRFYPKNSASSQPKVAWKAIDAITNVVIKEMLFPETYTSGQMIEIRIGNFPASYPAVRIEGFTATNVDVFGVAVVTRKYL